MILRNLCSAVLTLATAAALTLTAHAQNTYPSQQPDHNQQQASPSQEPNSATPEPGQPQAESGSNMAQGQHNWTTDQILTATVHQAWILSGKNEQNFFDIVRQLAEISAQNRNLVLPNDPASGKKAGEYIKEQAKADHDQLLYDIVDKAVRMTGTPAPESASANSK